MRLLNVKTRTFQDSALLDHGTPYVAASHRWLEGVETTFRDVRDRLNTNSEGYRKVEAFAEYVQKHMSPIEWLWIDTCCIDKSDNAELSRSINLMFHWYHKADRCLAYLADVETVEIDGSFDKSLWFTRGWTLQELLAPRMIVFVNKDWQVIGHKGDAAAFSDCTRDDLGPNLVDKIAHITRIPKRILQDYGASSGLSPKQKMKWMEGRLTELPEDKIYAMFGILSVTPGANYGEDYDGARVRLLTALDNAAKPWTHLMTRVDERVLWISCALIALVFLGRANLGMGPLGVAPKLSDFERHLALVMFYVPSIFFAIPSNQLLQRFKPRVWLTANLFLFGLTMTLQALVQNFAGLLASNFFLGLFETALFPGTLFLLSTWYRPDGAQKRFTYYFLSATYSYLVVADYLAVVSNIINEEEEDSAWRWTLFAEGTFIVAVSSVCFWLIPDFPEQAAWLAEDERGSILAPSGGSTRKPLDGFADVRGILSDRKIILSGFMHLGLTVSAYGCACVTVTILPRIESPAITLMLLLSVLGVTLAVPIAKSSDASLHRFPYAIFSIWMFIIGFALSAPFSDPYDGMRASEYVAFGLMTTGIYIAIPAVVCWTTMNLAGRHRRAVGSAWQLGFGNIGSIIAVLAFARGPITGYCTCLAFATLSGVACRIYGLACLSSNKMRKRTGNDDGLSEDDRTEMGDLNPDFEYLL